MVVSNINTVLVTCVTELEKQQARMEQYSRRNSVEISGISNEVSDENLRGKVICICKEAGIGLKLFDIEGCHRLPSGCINTSSNECVIVKSVNSKNSEAMHCVKESISSCSNVFATNSLCPYYHFLLGKCKNLQRKSSPLKKEKMALQLRSFLKVTYWFTY